ncbi:hypothetical protein KIN20_020056, partial [Parelaphostrongylus tenuis]
MDAPCNNPDSIEEVRRNFENNFRIYANYMENYITTARKEIDDLKLDNKTLKQKCVPLVSREKLLLEFEFSSLEKMSEWLTLTELDEGADRLHARVKYEDQQPDLKPSGTSLPKREAQEVEEKRERVLIHIPPRNKHP